MNKIKVIDKTIKQELEDVRIEIEDSNLLDVQKIIITPLKDTNLEIEYMDNSFKADIVFHINENIHFKLFELFHNENLKLNYTYNLDKYSYLDITKFYDSNNIKEVDTLNLNGEMAEVDFSLKTIANGKQNFNLFINHNCKNTISNIKNSGVNIKGSINFNVEAIIPSGSVNTTTNQNNRIITFNDNICKINPKLIVDEDDVVANHSALIGKFSEDELFYLMSRGIDYESAVILLLKGFLLEGVENETLNKIIEKYWR